MQRQLLFLYLNMENLYSCIKKIRSIDKSQNSSYDALYEILHSTRHIYFIGTLTKGSFLHRSRLNDKDNLDFNKIEQLSYRKDVDEINGYGRANKPKQSIFYCADKDYTAVFETSRLNRSCLSEVCEFEIITTGKWELKQDLNYILMWKSPNAIERNSFVKEYNKKIDGIAKNKFGEDSYKEIDNFLSFLSSEFTKKVNSHDDYKISCAFSNVFYMREDLDFNVDGISYPSAQSAEYGINLALFPEKIKEKIKLVSASRQTFILNKGQYIQIEDKQSKKIQSGNIYWDDSNKLLMPVSIHL